MGNIVPRDRDIAQGRRDRQGNGPIIAWHIDIVYFVKHRFLVGGRRADENDNTVFSVHQVNAHEIRITFDFERTQIILAPEEDQDIVDGVVIDFQVTQFFAGVHEAKGALGITVNGSRQK
jgi:hypothetical protein